MIFSRADILLPSPSVDLTKWSVIACDQHSSEPEYWDELDRFIGDAPSSLRMILPEAFLSRNISDSAAGIHAVMRKYLDEKLLVPLPASYVYVERTLASGAVRKGLVGAVDLNAYDYHAGSVTPIRATEGTVEGRLPPRVAVRQEAPLEMPHIMIFIDDPENTVFGSLEPGKLLYDFELNAGGGHLKGWQICGKVADKADAAFAGLAERAAGKYAGLAPVVMAMGDGNHSLATAKKCGDRYALAEVVNIHDPSISFEPIHRVLFGTDTSDFIRKFGSSVTRFAPEENYAALISRTDEFCREYIAGHGGKVDYIHNDDAAVAMGSRKGCAAILLPALDKATLFDSIVRNGPFPKKSFSIGHAEDKRYYLECRKLG